jgi:uncharacterized integral membrane protein
MNGSSQFLSQVAGEIPVNRQKHLRRGFMLSVFIVGILYLLVVIVFVSTSVVTLRLAPGPWQSNLLLAISWSQLPGTPLPALGKT